MQVEGGTLSDGPDINLTVPNFLWYEESELKSSLDFPGLLVDHQIRKLCLDSENPMISPFVEKLVEKGTISYGLSSCGYDATLAPNFKVFHNTHSGIVDPKASVEESIDNYIDVKDSKSFLIPPNGFVLGHTVEYFKIPRNVMVICLGKSTYARSGISVCVTPLEPEWEGQVVIEIVNHTPLPAKIYANEGICQFLFLKTSDTCEVSYKTRGGKYMGQTGITLPKISE